MELHILEHRLRVASIAKESIQLFTYGLIKLAFLSSKTRCKFFSLTETPEDYTIIVDEEGFLELPSSEHLSVADATWLALNVVSGGGGFSGSQPIGVTKIAKSVIAPLADQNISVFMLSTYQTDFILVRERDLPFVMHTLAAEFTILRVVNGETVAADDLGITNGFVKPKLVQRPVIHPLSSPSNMFCVTSLDPDTLPTVATLLMDVMFYSNGVKDSVVGNEDSGHIRFFSFSLIEGYISLVMDVQTQQRFPNNLLFTSASGELWKMVRIGGQPLGFDECGIVAQISEPLAAADIPAYYISTFKFDHALLQECSGSHSLSGRHCQDGNLQLSMDG
ncbi:cytosolic arginine sensor for mTORC1 subunit 2 isoform X7 [Gallus gallus]|uniref:GATS protein like 2 n=1 Tax=Gallus gallus TaxID=9031 RepID=A0A8V1ACK8_CHICK|nr:cytosolic arginine sensor for mTORC1 subunit 2 isoform X7 [Gallus gallus]XP_046785931.1 cytosolic arginine sensor for mTORC1 subunit 2 isoform X7 [Gallus gallus]